MRQTTLSLFFGLLCRSVEVSPGCTENPYTIRTYRQFLTPIFDEVYPCGGIAPNLDRIGDAKSFSNCIEMCQRYGRDYALANGCYSFSQAIEHGIFNDGRLGCSRVHDDVVLINGSRALPQDFTVSECAMSCQESPDCFYWEYSPALKPNGGSIDGNPDPQNPSKPWNTRVTCRLVSLDDWRQCGIEAPGHGTCNDHIWDYEAKITWNLFEKVGLADPRFESWASTVSAFANYRDFKENCRYINPSSSTTAVPTANSSPRSAYTMLTSGSTNGFVTGTTANTIKPSMTFVSTSAPTIAPASASSPLLSSTSSTTAQPSAVVTECAARITATQAQWVEDCQSKCTIFGPGGLLQEFCNNSNSNASSLIHCINGLTKYCIERDA